jgi:pimeloyl-ACP methyl ester carboxylesterase
MRLATLALRVSVSVAIVMIVGEAGARAAGSAPAALRRSDVRVEAEPGVTLFVRVVEPAAAAGGGAVAGDGAAPTVILVHGARAPGLASFDLAVPGGSLAGDLAAAGLRVLVMDVRGYGGSTRPAAMSAPPGEHAPLVRSDEVMRDLDAVAGWARAHGAERVALFGWATGAHWCGMYAALHPERVSHLVMLNGLYGADAPHALMGRGSDLEDRAHPGRFDAAAAGAYRLATAASLRAPWDRSIPVADRDSWRDARVAEAYVAAALASDPTAATRTPPSLRAPSGALEDSFYQASGRQLWDASLVRAATLIVRGERDFWSRPEDVARLELCLQHAARVRVVRLAGATHFVHLDRPERGRAELLREVLTFLRGP